MPAPASLSDFLDLAVKSGLLDKAAALAHRQRLEAAGTLPDSPRKLADLMIRDGLLTNFQADHLVAGKWRGFVIAGKYKLLQRVGAGGMGSVYLCEHILMKRRVALKVLPASQAEDKAALDRFHREARAVAALDHPNIVRAHDIDHEDKLHFLVMEYVDGSSLQDVVKRFGPMDAQRAAHYIAQAALGLQSAHEAGIVHRDIKPGNLLIDRGGTVKILDMGLARFFHDDRDELTKQYDAKSVLGTADYLAPEQALNSHEVDIRADIYSLGATLYFLLAGASPFQDGTVAQKLIWHQVREPKPLEEVRPEVAPELAAIVRKMMAKDPADRYQTPLELVEALAPLTRTPIPPPPDEEMPQLVSAAQAAGDGSRTLSPMSRTATRAGKAPLTSAATPPGSSRSVPLDGSGSTGRSRRGSDTQLQGQYASDSRIRKFRQDAVGFDPLRPYDPGDLFDVALTTRKRIWIGIAVACLLTTVGYGGVVAWAVARNSSVTAQEQQQQKQQVIRPPVPVVNVPKVVGQICAFEGHEGPVECLAVTVQGHMVLSGGADKVLRLWDVNKGKLIRPLIEHKETIHGVAISPDGQRALSAGWDKLVCYWDLPNGQVLKKYQGHTDRVQTVQFSPDGKLAVSGGSDHVAIVWDNATGQPRKRLEGHTGPVWSVAFAPDGERILSASHDRTVRIWDIGSGSELHRLEGHEAEVNAVAVSPTGRQAVSGGKDKSLRFWDVDSGKLLFTVNTPGVVQGLSFSPDGRYVLSAGDDQIVRLWEAATGYEIGQYKGHNQPVNCVQFARDGRSLFSGGNDNQVRQWALPRFTEAAALWEKVTFPVSADVIERVALSPDNKVAASAGADKVVRLWNVGAAVGMNQLKEHTEAVHSVEFSHDGNLLVSASKDTSLKIWDVAEARSKRTLRGHGGGVMCAVFSADDKLIVSGSQDKTIRLWNAANGDEIKVFIGHGNTVNSVCWVGKTRQFISASSDKTVRLWNADADKNNKELRRYGDHNTAVLAVACSPDGKTLLTGSQDGTLRFFDVQSGKLRARVATTEGKAVRYVSFSPDGRYALSCGGDKRIHLWDVERAHQVYAYSGHSNDVTGAVFSSDGRRFLSGGKDKSLRLWNLPDFVMVVPVGTMHVFRGHAKDVDRVAYSPDGKRILSAGYDNTVRLWNVETGKEMARFSEHTDRVHFVAFSPDGRLSVSASADKTVRIWDTETRQQVRVLIGHQKRVWSAVFTPDGKQVFSGGEDKLALLFDVESGKIVRAYAGHEDAINWVAVSPDGTKGLTASWDKTLRLWDLEKRNDELHKYVGHQGKVNCVAFSPDGLYALSGSSDKRVLLWELSTGNVVGVFAEHTSAIYAVAFSPEGKRFLSCGADKTIRYWDIPSKKLLHTFEGHTAAVTGVAFSPDGRFAVSSSGDTTLRLWGLPEPVREGQ